MADRRWEIAPQLARIDRIVLSSASPTNTAQPWGSPVATPELSRRIRTTKGSIWMRIAVLSDIHGFSLAFDSVLADLAHRGPVDQVVVAGDLCLVGPAPDEVIARLEGHDFVVLQGNTDRDLVEAANEAAPNQEFSYPLERIGTAGVEYLAGLSFSQRVTPPGGTSPQHDLLIVHANPFDLDAKLHPDMTDQALREVLGATRAAVVAFGHVHIPYQRQLDNTLLVDISAVGNPKDRDLRCAYGMFAWDEARQTWTPEIVRLPYPLAETQVQMRRSGMPHAERAIKSLIRASY